MPILPKVTTAIAVATRGSGCPMSCRPTKVAPQGSQLSVRFGKLVLGEDKAYWPKPDYHDTLYKHGSSHTYFEFYYRTEITLVKRLYRLFYSREEVEVPYRYARVIYYAVLPFLIKKLRISEVMRCMLQTIEAALYLKLFPSGANNKEQTLYRLSAIKWLYNQRLYKLLGPKVYRLSINKNETGIELSSALFRSFLTLHLSVQ